MSNSPPPRRVSSQSFVPEVPGWAQSFIGIGSGVMGGFDQTLAEFAGQQEYILWLQITTGFLNSMCCKEFGPVDPLALHLRWSGQGGCQIC